MMSLQTERYANDVVCFLVVLAVYKVCVCEKQERNVLPDIMKRYLITAALLKSPA
jgi:hypothetical protein